MHSQKIKTGLFTHFEIPKRAVLTASDIHFFIGSCFSDNMKNLLSTYQVKVNDSDFGAIYNPVSIEKILLFNQITDNQIINFQDNFYYLQARNKTGINKKEEIINYNNKLISAAKQELINANNIFVTLGSAWVYVYKETNEVVANCAKIPQSQFTKKLLSFSEISSSILSIIENIRMLNTNANILFTISPVKHLRDGIEENLLSKSILIAALKSNIAEIQKVYYFPAYEIVTEELRDHRFYKNDLMHPTEETVNYIFWRFIESMYDEKSNLFFNEVQEYLNLLNHKPSNEKLHAEIVNSKLLQIKNSFPNFL